MTYAPATLTALRSYLIKADPHLRGQDRHRRRRRARGQGHELPPRDARSFGWDAYSRQTARDKAGLTEAASAIDIGNHSGLRRLSVWLVIQARDNAPGTRDMREIIYSPDGVKVLRWDRERGPSSQPRPGEADSSHLTHTHVSYYRDSQGRDKVGVFRPYYEPEDEMDLYNAGQMLRRMPGRSPIV